MDKTELPINFYAPDFELPGTDGSVHHLARYLEKFQVVGVVIMCNHCPYVRMYLDRLKQIQADFQDQGFTLIGINANDDSQFPEDSFEKMVAFATEHQLNFPYLRDVTQDVAQGFGAERTPEVFLVDRTGHIRYNGAIDDHPQDSGAVQIHYFRDAITQLLSKTEISLKFAGAIGCSVKWRQ
ncbi:MAG: thioredoxin family protein [Cyanobacteria bacterium CRU_2_1]|nr:thioredoxin family protein [Cyanobacteria bacterium RU_5_0]NJR58021.1 thioredoxin family protein [Cyanobacteria bacterium CRU_2_1]